MTHGVEGKMGESSLRQRCRSWGGPAGRFLVVVAGICVGQAILYGPSLQGQKLLLPLDQLAYPNVYLPRAPDEGRFIPHDVTCSDLVFVFEPLRRFTAEELAQGRLTLWNPNQYTGAPMTYGACSPMWLLRCLVVSPRVLPWLQLFISLLIGGGTYLFCQQVLQVGFWPAAIAAWCYPMTGFFIFWEGFPLAWVAGWLPWSLWAVDKTVRRPFGWGILAVAAVTGLCLADRQLDIAGQVLLASGIYAVWRLVDESLRHWLAHRAGRLASSRLTGRQPVAPARFSLNDSRTILAQPMPAALALVCGWGLGFLLAAPCLLPTLEYSRTGYRMQHRGRGSEERPPVGLASLPQVVLPDMYGSRLKNHYPMYPDKQGSQMEGSAATYAGLLATLLVMPLAWCSRRHRSATALLTVLGLFTLGWSLNMPGVVQLLRLPGLNMMSHNRFVFVTSFAIIALAAIGLDVLSRGELKRQRWFWLPILVLVALLLWCIYRATVLPEPLATQLATSLQEGKKLDFVLDLAGVRAAQTSFVRGYVVATVLCLLGIAGWLLLWFRAAAARWLVAPLAALLLADLLWFAYGRNGQFAPGLYYPPVPTLQQIAQAGPGRIIGHKCLPAMLNQMCHLNDIRGDDGVEPARLIDLAMMAANPKMPIFEYAMTQWLVPKIVADRDEAFRLSPVLDMLNVRYVIFRGSPPANLKADFSSPDYWAIVNRRAMPRVYVPQRAETVSDETTRLGKLASGDFDPRQVAYVEEPIELGGPCRGSAEITDEIPTRVTVSADMQTPGLVVLSDLWDSGWKAYRNGEAVPILRTNHAIRGVPMPAGKGTIEFRYEPASLAWGLRLCGLALCACLAWAAAVAWNSHRRRIMV